MAKHITSFSIDWQSWDLQRSDEISRHVTIVNRNKRTVRHQMFDSVSKEPIEDREYQISGEQCDVFFEYLNDKANIFEWRDDYCVEVYDGWHWDVRIRFSDNTIKHTEGTLEPPPHGERIASLILALAEYSEQPLLF